ncbi:MAG TPA: response regulator transcription factor [Opitutaceae bacterium]|nr:response regulator transcription factor [Opitutaceae bacterium]
MSAERLRIFIVDDHPLVRDWLASLLRLQSDLEVCGEAGDPVRALAAMAANPPDVAIVDLSFKSGSGLDLIKDLRSRLPSTRVLVLSMHEEIGDIERALRAGARGYVMKRESTSQIVSAIRQVHAGKIYADPAVLAALAERMVGRSPDEAPASPEALSDRELDVFRRLGEGHSTRRIADDLKIGLKTVQTYYARIREKLGLTDAAELVRAAVRWNEGKRP